MLHVYQQTTVVGKELSFSGSILIFQVTVPRLELGKRAIDIAVVLAFLENRGKTENKDGECNDLFNTVFDRLWTCNCRTSR